MYIFVEKYIAICENMSARMLQKRRNKNENSLTEHESMWF